MAEEIPGLKGLAVRMLLESPGVSARAIWEAAVSRYPAVRSLSVREFGGRYVLPLKRQMRRARPRRAPEEPSPGAAARPTAPPPPSSGIPLLDAVIADGRSERARTTAAMPASAGSRVADGAGPARGNGGVGTPGERSRERGAGGPADEAGGGGGSAGEAVGGGGSLGEAGRGAGRVKGKAIGQDAAPASDGRPATHPSRVRPRASLEAPEIDAEHVRTLFMRLALEITMAETDPELIEVVARLERYVDEALGVAA